METKIKKLENSQVEIVFEVPWPEFEAFLEKQSSLWSRSLHIPGFRPGSKIPLNLLEREIGSEKILTEGAEAFIKEKYHQFILEKNLEVIGSPRVEVLKLALNNPFTFKVEAEILPQIELPDYKKIASEIPLTEGSAYVEEREVEDSLKWLQMSRAKFKDSLEGAKEGNLVSISYQSSQIENGKTFQDRFLLGKGGFVKGFEEELFGLKKDEEKVFKVLFPNDYQKKELAGKEVEFKVKVDNVQEVELPALNNEFAQKLGKFEDLESLRKSIKEGILIEKKNKLKQERVEKILDKLAQQCHCEIPQTLVDIESQRLIDDFKNQIEKELKVSFSDYLKNIKETEESLKKSFSERARNDVKKFLILREIGKREKIQVTDQEIEDRINQEVMRNYSDVETARKKVDMPKLKNYYRSVIYNEKVMQLLEKAH